VLPQGRPLKPNDECWFSAVIERPHSGAAHTSSFVLQNGSNGSAKLSLFDESGNAVEGKSGTGDARIDYSHSGRTTVNLILTRDACAQIEFKVGCADGTDFFKDDNTVRPFMLRCVDETGVDFLGADEFRLRGKADQVLTPFLSIDWDDADSGDYWLRGSTKIDPIGYLEGIKFDLGGRRHHRLRRLGP
jgi:hypothetical protein